LSGINESTPENTVLAWLENLDYEIVHGPDIAFDGSAPERDSEANYTDVVLVAQLRSALERINFALPISTIDEAVPQYYSSRESGPPSISKDASL